jgi:hypothetical protein
VVIRLLKGVAIGGEEEEHAAMDESTEVYVIFVMTALLFLVTVAVGIAAALRR